MTVYHKHKRVRSAKKAKELLESLLPMNFKHFKAGDTVTRMLAGQIPIQLTVIEVTEQRIIAGAWQFDRDTGAEIDDDLDWGPPPKMTGSYLKP